MNSSTASREPRRWWIAGALMLSMVLVGLDSTVLNVALPTLAVDLGASTADLQWIVDAFVLVLAGLILPVGALADRYGRRPTLLTGLAVFTAGSVWAAVSGSVGMLIAARAVMGAGAAVIMTVPLALVTTLFDDDERPRAIATFAVAMGLGLPLGPIVGGWLLQHYAWGSVFLINAPLGLLAVLGVAVLLPDSRDPSGRPADVVGALASTAGLVSLVYGVVEAPVRGWTSGPVLGFGGLGLVLLAGFAWWERRCDHPMIDLSLLARPRFAWGTLCVTLAMFAMLGMLFVVPLYLQAVRGHDPLATGIRLLPMIAGLVVGAKAGEAATSRLGAKVPVVAGLSVILAGLLWGATATVGTGYPTVSGWLTLIGAGMGLTMTPGMDAALGEVPQRSAGSGSALTMALRQVGGALGVAVLGSILGGTFAGRLDVTGLPAPLASTARESVSSALAVAARTGDAALAHSAAQAFVHGMSAVMLTGAGLAAVGAVVAALLLPARADGAARGSTSTSAPHGESATIPV